MINNYEEFIGRVEALGFMFLSNVGEGIPSVGGETLESAWHTGIVDTDPWQWKDKAADEKRLAFGSILGGQKGFVSKALYPYFYKACSNELEMEERWMDGTVSPMTYQLWQLMHQRSLLNTSDIRQAMGVTAKEGGSKLDSAIVALQKEYIITVAGSRRKLNKQGEPYGWPANVYDLTVKWAPKDWLEPVEGITKAEAISRVEEALAKQNVPRKLIFGK